MSDESNIIDFQEARKRGEHDLGIMRAREKTGKWCRHNSVLVGDDFGDVECALCGVRLDAHAVLLDYARGERHFRSENERAKGELARLQKEIAELKAEEKRLKSRVKRARQTVDAAEVKLFARGMVEKLEVGEP